MPRAIASFALLSGLFPAIMSCGGGDGGTDPDVVGSITITPANPTAIPAGSTLQLTATVLSTRGKPMSGSGVAFSTSSPTIVSVSSSGQVTSLGPTGSASVTAAVGGVHNAVTVTVVAGPPASLTRTSPDPGTVAPGATVGDSVRFVVKDNFGNPRPQETITFSVTAGGGQASPTTARTDALGRAATVFTTGIEAGSNALNASVTGLPPLTLSLITAVGSVMISSISPSPMTPGASVTIDGAGFDANASGDAVSIDGFPAAVSTASATRLVVVVPSILPCRPTHQANVQVTASGGTAIGRQALTVASVRSLAIGNSIVLTEPADVACTELAPASGRYAVNVVNAGTIPTSISAFQFVGAASVASGAAPAPNVPTLRQAMSTPVFRQSVPGAGPAQYGRQAAHIRRLESDRLVYARMKNSFRRTPRRPPVTAGGGRAALAVAVPAIGETRTFRMLQPSSALGATVSCADFIEVTARVAYVGSKAIVYEDVKAPLAGQMDAYFARLGQEFDTSMYPSDATYFGDPLATDPVTDNDQHLTMLFTPSVPSGLAGFIVSCDLFPRNTTNNQVSNFGEYFYARVPTQSGTGFMTDTPDAWLRQIRSTVVHEVKHIASFGAHLVNGAPSLEESWLEESTAMIAEEVWARDRIYPGASWKGNMTYDATLFCDVRPSLASCNGPPLVMFDHFARLYDFMQNPGSTSPFGRVADNDFTFYASGWSFVRYAADRYATSEVDFLRGINQSVDLTGLANVARQAGTNTDLILANWSMSLYLDENPAMGGNTDIRFPSWNMRDIFSGMNRDFQSQGSFTSVYPLVPLVLSGGDFNITNQGLHGGGFASYDLFGLTAASRTIGVSGAASARIVVARIQ